MKNLGILTMKHYTLVQNQAYKKLNLTSDRIFHLESPDQYLHLTVCLTHTFCTVQLHNGSKPHQREAERDHVEGLAC